MPLTSDDLLSFLDRLGIATVTVDHPPLFSVDQSRHLRGEIPGAHTKNLFLTDRKDRLFLVVAEESAVIDLKRLHEKLGASGRLSFGKADKMREALGVEPGSVTPFAAINDTENRVGIVIDHALSMRDPLNFHPLVNTRTTRIKTADLLRLLEAVGHPPRILAVSEPVQAIRNS
jgi:Ala-tRNA(Pro) deacylase